MAHCPGGNSSPRLRPSLSGHVFVLSRKLLTGLFALVVALAVTIWALVLVREEPAPPSDSRVARPAAPAPDTGTVSEAPPQRQPAPAVDTAPAADPAPTPAVRAMAAGYKALMVCGAVFNAREAGAERTLDSIRDRN